MEALRTSPKDPTAIYGDLKGFDQAIMSFRCPASSGFTREDRVILRGTLTSKRSVMHRGFDLELKGHRVGTWMLNEPPSIDQSIVERTTPKVSLERFLVKDDVKRLVLIGTKTGIADARTALSRGFGEAIDEIIAITTLEELAPVIAEAAKNYDGLCLLRGGGDANSFATWQDGRLIDALLRCGKPFYTALGHTSDVTLADKHADESFATPTLFGAACVEAWQARRQREQLERRIQTLDLINRDLKAANKSAHDTNLDRKLSKLQNAFDELKKLTVAAGRQNEQTGTAIAKRLRYQTWTWLLTVFFLGIFVGGVSFYEIENLIVHRPQQTMQTVQPQSPYDTKPPGIKRQDHHGN